MSAFLDWINLLELEVNIYHNLRVCGDWKITEHELGATCFHIATQGGFELHVPNHGDWVMEEGDLVIFPRELAHTMISNVPMEGKQKHLPICSSQDKTGTTMLCGKISFIHNSSKHLLDALPPVFIIRREDSTAWLSQILFLILDESIQSKDSSNTILTRLCELLFSYALRDFVENTHLHYQENLSGVIALYGHEKIQRALNQIHAKPAHNWHLDNLAKHAGMSRTSFINTFKKLSGMTPMKYLMWWRMQLAWKLLVEKNTVSQTAERIGYQSEAAFSRAFYKHFGFSAGKVRRREL